MAGKDPALCERKRSRQQVFDHQEVSDNLSKGAYSLTQLALSYLQGAWRHSRLQDLSANLPCGMPT